MKATRNLIAIGQETEHFQGILHHLEEHEWNVCRTDTIRQAWKRLHETSYPMGIIYFEETSDDYLREMEGIINEFMTRWIAIASPEALRSPAVCTAISRLFSGVHALPIENDNLLISLENVSSLACLDTTETVTPPEGAVLHDCRMVGTSAIMKSLYRTIHKVAVVDAPVFIQGESGTGKELTARAIHEESSRSGEAFNAVNCGALPANLIQSELFGHEKGAFTGASQRKTGIIESTQGGTLFLDEIGDLPLDMQVNLLRFLENHTIQRVGGLKEIEVDVRVLAATHVDLENAVAEGRFREDLYHRLNVLQVKVPALRERGEDIEILAKYFFKCFSNEKSMQVKGFTKESLAIMRLYDWPGNIRELINRVRRAMVMCEHPLIRPSDLGLERRHSPSRYAESLEEARDMAERSVVLAGLSRNSFNVQHAARELGISRVTLYRLMEKHHIHRDSEEACHREGTETRSAPNIVHLTALKKNR
ncbi:sigma-54 dependent transcriptional regulator [Halomonas organivorans]